MSEDAAGAGPTPDLGAAEGTPPAGSLPLLEVEAVNKAFPGVQALTDMRLALRYGEVLALVGENGAGKSTLMKLLSGIEAPDTGSFWLQDQQFRPMNPRQAQQAGISIIHQEFNLMPDLTVAQNIFIGREPGVAGVLSEQQLNRKALDLVRRLELPLDVRTAVGDLTVAGQQMTEIAKALSHRARVLIMDEPTAALNEAEVESLHQLIRRFVGPETAVIYISHRMDELKRISDRITVIRDGEYVDTLETAETSVAEVISLMVGRELAGEDRPVGVRSDREVLLEVERLSTKPLLRDVGFTLQRGEILGFAGLMGAGRTEVARALVGADPVRSKTVRLNGRTIRIRTPADAAKYRIGYLSEDRKLFGLLLEQDVATNVALPSLAERFQWLGFVRGRSIRGAAAEMVRLLGIKTPSVEQRVEYLSGGNQQKVVIAKWLVKDCDILIFDEPTRGIDVGAKEEIYALLNELADQGKSIIMISSELPEVLRMSHRIVVMNEGRVNGILEAAEADQERVMQLATDRETSDPTKAPTPEQEATR